MRILYVITGGDIGGAQRHVYYLAEWFLANGHEVEVVVGENGPFVDLLTRSHIKTTIISIPRSIEVWKDLKATFEIYRFIKKGKFDIIHSHSSKAGIIARIAGFMNHSKKNIFTAHGFVFTDPTLSKKKRAFYLTLEKMCSWLSTDIITVSNFDYKKGIEYGLNDRKMHVVHNGIPNHSIISVDGLEKKILSRQNRNKRIIGFVGRFVSEKNIDMILRVATLFKNQENQASIEFWLIGDGPLFDHYQTEIEKQGLSRLVQLKGNQDQILSWMDQMDLLIITSHKEGLPYVLLEALSRGLPVVSTDVGGVKEVLNMNDIMDMIVPINDDLQMYDKIQRILENKALYKDLAKGSLRLGLAHTVENMCVQTNKVYRGNKFDGTSHEGTLYDYRESQSI